LGTAAGLAWSRDSGDSWHFVRGRDYGDKIRFLLAGTPHGWREMPRKRFGELFPEDNIVLLQEDAGGVLWIGTRSLGCVAIKPEAFYQTPLPRSGSLESQEKFLEEVARESTRYHRTKDDQVLAMAPLPDGKILLASRMGSLEKMEHPDGSAGTRATDSTEKTDPTTQFPSPYPLKPVEQNRELITYPHVIVLADDYSTRHAWEGHYGKTYALVSGGKDSHNRIIAFDESLCRARLFVGFVGNRTRPLESMTLPQGDGLTLNTWQSFGSGVAPTADGQHLWCEVQFAQPGRYGLSLFFVDPDAIPRQNVRTQAPPRDYLVEIFPEPPPARTRIARSDWQEPGRRADEWATQTQPLAVTRAIDFGDGVYKRFELAGPGTYYVKIDKNFSRMIDLSAVLIDRLDVESPSIDDFDMTTEQPPDTIP
jgi:hypothetical protein